MTESLEPEKGMPDTTVWPPPPTNSPPTNAGAIPAVFLPVQGPARALVILLRLYAILAVLGFTEALTAAPTAARRSIIAGITFVQALLLMATGLCFLIWTFRLYKNLRAFGISGLRNGPGWAAAYFVIPILSLYRPYQVFREIWQASDPSPPVQTGNTWRAIKVPVLLIFWWLSFLLMNIMDALSSQSDSTSDIDAADNAVSFISALLALQVVRLWTARQEKTARSLSLLP